VASTTFLYTIDGTEAAKGQIAQHWLQALTERNMGVTNLQVLNEVTSVIARKSHAFGRRDPFFETDAFATFGSTPLTNEAALAARGIFLCYHYSWWDCLLLASAIELGCMHFLSEDLQDGQTIEGASCNRRLTIVDPFAHSPDQFTVRTRTWPSRWALSACPMSASRRSSMP
jgi:predicted nucleic acid-binding protein